ncbi:MAG: hypothetical protein E7045_10035 [Lentisphaerae bacterium]|nr:hypothetical protein [Lentisphaerota bacterium]
MAFKWLESHAHLNINFSYKALDNFAEDSSCLGIWMHALEATKVNPCYAGNDLVLEVAKHYPGFIEPFAYCRADRGADEVKRFKDAGFTGLKFLDPVKDYDDPEFFPVYAEAEKLGMPCFFHVGVISRKRSSQLWDPRMLATPCRMKPSMLDTIAAEFPELQIIAGHPGFPWCNETYESLWFYPNIKCSVCGMIDYKWLIDSMAGMDDSGVKFTEKFMFATDGDYGNPDGIDYIRERTVFFKVFFEEAGKTYFWRNNSEEFLYKNAEKFLKDLRNK